MNHCAWNYYSEVAGTHPKVGHDPSKTRSTTKRVPTLDIFTEISDMSDDAEDDGGNTHSFF